MKKPDTGSPSPAASRKMAQRFPIGASLDLADLFRDPYPVYACLREFEPITYVPTLDMYLVTRYGDVAAILRDTENFVVGTERSTVFDTFGEHMMTVEGERHDHYKAAHQPFFMPARIRDTLEAYIRKHVDSLIDEFAELGEIEFRSGFASRLPILTMLSVFGLSMDEEPKLRAWYDSFEKSLSNFTWDETIRAEGRRNAQLFIEMIQKYLDLLRTAGPLRDESTLLHALLDAPEEERLSDEQICRNALIIFFGGISTVEALLLNSMYALSLHRDTLVRVRDDLSLIPSALNETVRWLSPVQSATRHLTGDLVFGGIEFRNGDTANCMLAAANRDPAMFEHPDRFDIDRTNVQRHLGFVVGPHHCLGSRLARTEARIALEQLFSRLRGFHFDIDRVDGPFGYEFRQPAAAVAVWQR